MISGALSCQWCRQGQPIDLGSRLSPTAATRRKTDALSSRHKAQATSAFFLDVRILENELRRDLVLFPVHFAVNDTEECFAVNENFHTVLRHDFVELARLVDVFEVVLHACTTFVSNPDTNELRVGRVQQA